MSLDVRMLQINREEICIFDKEHCLFFNPKNQNVEHLEFKQFFTSDSHYNSQKVNQNFAVLMKNGDIVGNDNFDEKLFKFSQ